jgi:hypothetical protein
MAARLAYPFGSIDVETAGRWLQLPPEDDGHVWILNLMKYKAVADYGDAGGPAISGREADDTYAPTAILADLGATVPLFGDVIDQVGDHVAWERIAMVRYPSRASFFAMQERGDFQKQYVHKQAGMETTIVMGCVPAWMAGPAGAGSGPVVMRVLRFAQGGGPGPDPEGVIPLARFAVDGVILGDGRRWDEVRFDRMEIGAPVVSDDTDGLADQVVAVIDPLLEDLVGSVTTAGE